MPLDGVLSRICRRGCVCRSLFQAGREGTEIGLAVDDYGTISVSHFSVPRSLT